MALVTGIYSRAARLDSLLLRTVMWSSWSHVAIVMPGERTVIDATFLHGGVRERSLGEFMAAASKTSSRQIEVPDPEAGYTWARGQIGKPYDWTGVLGIGLHRDWQADDSWFCSDFYEAFLAACGRQRFINQARRVTPQMSWMVA